MVANWLQTMSTPTVWVWVQENAPLESTELRFIKVLTLKNYYKLSYAIEIHIK